MISFFEQGFKDGHAHGRLHGVFEGRALGREKGFEIWEEIGFYEGQAKILLSVPGIKYVVFLSCCVCSTADDGPGLGADRLPNH